jgi:transcription elongation factor Elf1
MNVTIMSQLYFTCPYCDLKYFSTSHLIKNRDINNDKSKKVCRICREVVEPENIALTTHLNDLNLAIELVFPRGLVEYDLGNEQHLKILRYIPNITYYNFMKYTIKRLNKRTRYGEWKVIHYKNRVNILTKSLSINLSECLIKNILEYIDNYEQAVLYKELITLN